jgi:hypothetical protein
MKSSFKRRPAVQRSGDAPPPSPALSPNRAPPPPSKRASRFTGGGSGRGWTFLHVSRVGGQTSGRNGFRVSKVAAPSQRCGSARCRSRPRRRHANAPPRSPRPRAPIPALARPTARLPCAAAPPTRTRGPRPAHPRPRRRPWGAWTWHARGGATPPAPCACRRAPAAGAGASGGPARALQARFSGPVFGVFWGLRDHLPICRSIISLPVFLSIHLPSRLLIHVIKRIVSMQGVLRAGRRAVPREPPRA